MIQVSGVCFARRVSHGSCVIGGDLAEYFDFGLLPWDCTRPFCATQGPMTAILNYTYIDSRPSLHLREQYCRGL